MSVVWVAEASSASEISGVDGATSDSHRATRTLVRSEERGSDVSRWEVRSCVGMWEHADIRALNPGRNAPHVKKEAS
jgi:hypothetical protein